MPSPIDMSPCGYRQMDCMVAAGVEDNKGAAVIYTILTNGGTSRQRRTPLDSDSRYPAWTDDSRRFAFQSNRKGDLGIWWQAADGTDEASRLTTAATGEEHIPESWSPDRTTLLYSVTINGIASLWTMTVRNGTPGKSATIRTSDVHRPDECDILAEWESRRLHANGKGGHHGLRRAVSQPVPGRVPAPNLADSPKHPRWSSDSKHYLLRPAGGRL